MTMLQRKQMEKVLKKFNDDECGGGYLYFVHEKELVQLDLCDYSCCTVCTTEDIESVQFIEEDDNGLEVNGIYIELKDGVYEFVDSVWIDCMGCQM